MANTQDNRRSGGEILVDCLKTHGARRAFAVPGESFLAVLDALHDAPEIDLMICRLPGGMLAWLYSPER